VIGVTVAGISLQPISFQLPALGSQLASLTIP
jgi:hypothetical protein